MEFIPTEARTTIKVLAHYHVRGNTLCASCTGTFPRACTCGGLIHQEQTPREIATRCDKCGTNYEERPT